MLSGQLLASKLNINNGVASCDSVNTAITDADSLLSSAKYAGPKTTQTPRGDLKTSVVSVSDTLDSYNIYGCPPPNSNYVTR